MSYSPGVGLKLNKTFVNHSHKCCDNVSPSTSGRLDRFLVKSFVAGFVSTFLFKQPGELLLKTKRQLCMDEGSIQALSSTSPHSMKCVDAVNGNGAICHFSEINLLPKKTAWDILEAPWDAMGQNLNQCDPIPPLESLPGYKSR